MFWGAYSMPIIVEFLFCPPHSSATRRKVWIRGLVLGMFIFVISKRDKRVFSLVSLFSIESPTIMVRLYS